MRHGSLTEVPPPPHPLLSEPPESSHLRNRLLLPQLLKWPLSVVEAKEVAEETAETNVAAEAAADLEEIIIIVKIILPTPTKIKTKVSKVKRLTRRALRPAQMFQEMPVLVTGKKAGMQLIALTLWSAVGPTSLSLENEESASLTK